MIQDETFDIKFELVKIDNIFNFKCAMIEILIQMFSKIKK